MPWLELLAASHEQAPVLPVLGEVLPPVHSRQRLGMMTQASHSVCRLECNKRTLPGPTVRGPLVKKIHSGAEAPRHNSPFLSLNCGHKPPPKKKTRVAAHFAHFFPLAHFFDPRNSTQKPPHSLFWFFLLLTWRWQVTVFFVFLFLLIK
jgi:hypothetical protein